MNVVLRLLLCIRAGELDGSERGLEGGGMDNIYYKIDPREERLPKWAQDHINSFRASIRQMQKALEQDVNDSNTFLHGPHGIEPEALGKSPRITFKVPTGKAWGDEFNVHVEGDTLKVYAATTVLIKPTSSNCLEIRMEDRR